MRYFIHLESYQTISIMANYITSIAQTIEVGVLGRPMIRTRSVHRAFFNDTLQMHFYNILKSYAYQISLKDSYFHILVTGKGYTKIYLYWAILKRESEVGVLGRPMIRTRSVHRAFFNDTLQMHFYNILKSYAYQISLKDSYFHTLVTGKGYTKISIMANGICKYYLRYYFLGFIYALLEYSDLMSAQNISLYSLKYINTD